MIIRNQTLLPEAMGIIQAAFRQMAKQEIECPLPEANRMMLSRNCYARREIPAHDCARFDGYAFPSKEINQKFQIAGTIVAGERSVMTLKTDQTYKIMTGSVIPNNCVLVMPKENVIETGQEVFFTHLPEWDGIIRKGSQLTMEQLVAEKGTILSPVLLERLLSAGFESVFCYGPWRCVIVNSGDELVNTHNPALGLVRNSNGLLLQTLCRHALFSVNGSDILEDDPDLLVHRLEKKTSDIIFMTGGTGPGERDYTRSALLKSNWTIDIEALDMHPGHSFLFATRDNELFFGFPGPPGTVYLLFQLFVTLVLRNLWQNIEESSFFSLPLAHDFLLSTAHATTVKQGFINAEGEVVLQAKTTAPTSKEKGQPVWTLLTGTKPMFQQGDKVSVCVLE